MPEIRFSDLAMALAAGLSFSLSFRFNQSFDSYFVYAQGISFLFIPAGVKLLFVLVGRLPAVVGLLIAGTYHGMDVWFDQSLLTIFFFAFVGLMSYPVSAYFVMRWLGIHRNLYNLRYMHVVTLSLVASITNGFVHNLAYLFKGVTNTGDLWIKSAAMALGDFLGCFVVVALFHTCIQIYDFSKNK